MGLSGLLHLAGAVWPREGVCWRSYSLLALPWGLLVVQAGGTISSVCILERSLMHSRKVGSDIGNQPGGHHRGHRRGPRR